MRQQSNIAYPLSDLIMITHYDPDPSLDLIHHQTLRCILSLDQSKHQKPITCIFYFDLKLHKIFITSVLIPWIFSSLYTQILCQYLGSIPRTKYLVPNTLDQNLGFPTCTRFSSCGSECIHIRSFCSLDERVYVVLTKWTYVYFLNCFTSTFSFTLFILVQAGGDTKG